MAETGEQSNSETETGPHRPAGDKEEIYFEGSPHLRGELGKMGLALLIGLGLIVLGIVLRTKLPWWGTALFIVAGILCPFIPVIFIRTTRYRVSNYRIDYERGILSKSIDTLELWHVADIQFRQSLLERILAVGRITIISDDSTTPHLTLAGLPDPRPLFDALKQRVIAVKRQRGVIKMDVGHAHG